MVHTMGRRLTPLAPDMTFSAEVRADSTNNVLEQDRRLVKKSVVASQGFRFVDGALNTIPGHDVMKSSPRGGGFQQLAT